MGTNLSDRWIDQAIKIEVEGEFSKFEKIHNCSEYLKSSLSLEKNRTWNGKLFDLLSATSIVSGAAGIVQRKKIMIIAKRRMNRRFSS